MRITFVTSKINFERAGGSVPDFDLKVRDMQARGASVRAVTLFSESNLLPKLPYAVSEYFIRGRKSLFAINRSVFAALKKQEKETDVFHVEGQFAYGAALYRLFGGKPVVLFFNREMLVWEKKAGFRHAVRHMVERLLYQVFVPRVDHLYFTTPQLRDCYFSFGLRVPQSRISTMLDFFDPGAIQSKAGHTSRQYTDNIRIFASGRMIPEKGFALLVEALARLSRETLAHVNVVIGGDGPERGRLQALTKERGLAEKIAFPGWVGKNAFWKLFSGADIFVLPRWRIEQPSVVVMEALSLGVPTVAPGGGGVEWMGQAAIAAFKNDDAASLATVLGRLIASREERAHLSEAAVARVQEIRHETLAPELWNIFQKFV